MDSLASDNRYVTGLFIHAYGTPNEVPCATCESRFINTDSGDHRGMYPFFGCRSMPDISKGSCSNCARSVTAHNCTFRDEKFSHFMAKPNRRPAIVEDINPVSSPRAPGMSYPGKMLVQYFNRRDQSVAKRHGSAA